MKTLPFFLLSALLWLPSLCAQTDPRTAGTFGMIYRLTDPEAALIYKIDQDKQRFDTAWLHTPVDTFHGLHPVRPLPPGHYLLVRALEETLFVETWSVNTLQISLLETNRDFAFLLLDTLGRPVRDASAQLGGRAVPFDPRLDCYRLPRRKKGGFLRVTASGETLLRHVEYDFQRSIWQQRVYRWKIRGWGKVVWAPVASVQRAIWRAKTARIHRRYDSDERRFGGYLALNQPMYRPGDTLRVKAYLTGRRGRPWRKPVDFRFVRRYGSDVFSRRTVAPAAPGVFILDLPLGDSLTLDREYSVVFSQKKKNEDAPRRRLGQSFRYEDYLLDEVTYTFDAEKTTFHYGEPVTLRLTARDANGQPVSDAEVEWVFLRQSAEQFYEPEVAVPDTLWRGRSVFSSAGEALLVLADSLWPAARLSVKAQAFCINGAGEMQTKTTHFTVDRGADQVEIDLAQGMLSLRWKGAPGAAPDSVLLLEKWPEGHVTTRTVALPNELPLNPALRHYTVLDPGNPSEPLLTGFSPGQDGIEGYSTRQGDTVRFVLRNTNRLPLRYWISRDARVIETGATADEHWQWEQPHAAGHAFYLYYTFLWKGETQTGSVDAPHYAKLLQIRLEHPATVAPGASVPVKVRVVDARNRPAAGVEVTAGAYNAEFGDEDPFSPPRIRVRPSTWPLQYGDFSVEEPAQQQFRVALDNSWYDRLQLDSVLYYRLRSRGDGLYTESFAMATDSSLAGAANAWPAIPTPADSFYVHRPQFTPYVFRKRRAEPVFLVYCNNWPVYYSGATDRPPYSFFGQHGYNQIKIRTRDGEYTLDSVWLEAGKKLEIALDADRWLETQNAIRVSFQPGPDTLTAFEQALLRKTMLLWQPVEGQGPHYFWHYADNIHRVVPEKWELLTVAGPFPPNTELFYYHPGRFLSKFQFEPGFVYEIAAGRERLYASDWPRGQTQLRFLPRRPQNPGARALGPHDIPAPQLPPPLPKYITAGRDQSGLGKLLLRFAPADTVDLVAIVLLGDTLVGPFRPETRALPGLPPGRYRLMLFTRKGQVVVRNAHIRRDTLLFLDLDGMALQMPAPGESWPELFPPVQTETSDLRPASGQPSRFSQLPGRAGEAVLRGTATDENGEPLIGATVKLFQQGTFVAGGITDFNGEYGFRLSAGVYDMEVSYTGYFEQRITGIIVPFNVISLLDVELTEGVLYEVEITAYKIPLIEQDQTSTGHTLSYRREQEFVVSAETVQGSDTDLPADILPDESLAESGPDSAGLRRNFRDYAFWQPHLRTDARGEAFFQADFPDDITSWNVFAVGMDGRGRGGVGKNNVRAFKRLYAQLALPRFAVAGDRFEAVGRAVNRTGDSLDVRTRFSFGGRALPENSARIGPGLVEFVSVDIPETVDSITLGYAVQGVPGADGEERRIAVQRAGIEERSGQFLLLEGDTTLTLQFDPALGPVTVQAQTNALDLLLDDIDYLENYPYDCNEQTASRLIALLLYKQISGYRQRPFSQEKALRQTLQRLQNSQNPDGSWGWWPGGAPNAWMTGYVVRALQRAGDAGYASANARERGLTWLRVHAPTLPAADRREALILLRESGVNVDCAPFLTALDSLPARTLDERLDRLYLQQLCGQPVPVDSLQRLMLPTALGGLYCGEESANWHDRRAANTLRAYEIATAGSWDHLALGIRRYWLESRSAARPRNTFETALILQALMPTVLAEGDTLTGNRLSINGWETSDFPFRRTFPPGEILQVKKTGAGPLYLSVYQQFFNENPAPRTDLYELTTRLEQGGRPVVTLETGKPAELVVEVLARQYAEYVMLEVPLPAGCSYGDKIRGPLPETHREHFRDRAVLFFETLPAGRFAFHIPLEPRFSGVFTQNPAQVAMMYFPVLFGRGGMGRVKIAVPGR